MDVPMNSITWLQNWYYTQCDDAWEHRHGITIQSCDNPGWLVKIDLAGTLLENLQMEEVGKESTINHSGINGYHDWLHCKVEDGFFIGGGGPFSLTAICDVFRDWVARTNG